jgi:hypothetical protein
LPGVSIAVTAALPGDVTVVKQLFTVWLRIRTVIAANTFPILANPVTLALGIVFTALEGMRR